MLTIFKTSSPEITLQFAPCWTFPVQGASENPDEICFWQRLCLARPTSPVNRHKNVFWAMSVSPVQQVPKTSTKLVLLPSLFDFPYYGWRFPIFLEVFENSASFRKYKMVEGITYKAERMEMRGMSYQPHLQEPVTWDCLVHSRYFPGTVVEL